MKVFIFISKLFCQVLVESKINPYMLASHIHFIYKQVTHLHILVTVS